MENLQLQGSVVCASGNITYTLFIAYLDGKFGVVRAGDWETVLPFRFEEISPLQDGCLAALSAGHITIYRPVASKNGCRFVPLRPQRRLRAPRHTLHVSA